MVDVWVRVLSKSRMRRRGRGGFFGEDGMGLVVGGGVVWIGVS